MNATPLLIATTNRGKLHEIQSLLGDVGVPLAALPDDRQAPQVEEDGDTYLANAKLKAIAIARWSGQVALADDSGLEVDALNGAPGVHAARYAGPQQDSQANVAKLLAALDGLPLPQRTARFRCVIVVARPDGTFISSEGTCEGLIAQHPSGDGGFGYDPVFYYPPLQRTLAELTLDEKNRISHRAQACAALRPELLKFLS